MTGAGGNVPQIFCPLRLLQIPGFEDRKNDLVYCRPTKTSEKSNLVVFFPGDVQDFAENMQIHRDNKRYMQWNLESTAIFLHQKFSDCHILLVKASRMDLKTFACFQNFVKSENLGVPEHTLNHNSLLHLENLIKNASLKLRSMNNEEIKDSLNLSKVGLELSKNNFHENNEFVPDFDGYKTEFDNSDIKLIGFSKGCVVLNQFLHEMHNFLYETEQDEQVLNLLGRIKDMYWLDGGHNGGHDTWITCKEVLGSVSKTGINIHIHVTPYQIKDDRRPWIQKEEKAFYEILKTLGCNVERKVHFETFFNIEARAENWRIAENGAATNQILKQATGATILSLIVWEIIFNAQPNHTKEPVLTQE